MIPRDSKERAEFVRLVDLERDAGKSIDKAVADVRGAAAEPTADQYVEWKGLIDEVKGGSVQSQHWALRTLNFFLGFFSSGFFFMLTGGGFIYFAATLHGGQHTAFTFILAVLGIAILLFGTGTLSAGRFSTTTESDWKIQGSLAGGAGVLAIIFGWALLEKHEDMRKAFESQTQFMIFSLEMVEATQSGKPVLVRDKFLLEPMHGFSPVPVSTRTSHFEILVPYQSHSRPCSTKISAKLHFVDPATGKPGDQKPIVDYFDVVLPDGSKCDGTKDVNVEKYNRPGRPGGNCKCSGRRVGRSEVQTDSAGKRRSRRHRRCAVQRQDLLQ